MSELKNFEFVTTLVEFKKKFVATLVEFEKIESDDKTRYDTLYSNSKAELIINGSDMDDGFESIYPTIISDIEKSLGKDSVWIVDSGIDQVINSSKYNPLPCSSYAKLPIDLDDPRKGLINIENIDDDDDDDKCFKWCLVRYLYPADHHQARITKANKDFEKEPDFKVITFPVKIRDIHKIEKRIPSPLVCLVMKVN